MSQKKTRTSFLSMQTNSASSQALFESNQTPLSLFITKEEGFPKRLYEANQRNKQKHEMPILEKIDKPYYLIYPL